MTDATRHEDPVAREEDDDPDALAGDPVPSDQPMPKAPGAQEVAARRAPRD